MDYRLIALTVAPGLAIALYVYWRDKFDREPLRLLALCFFLGILSTLPVLFVNMLWQRMGFGISSDLLSTAVYAFVCVAGTEELAKFLVLRMAAYPRMAFNEPYDGITYSVMVAMGFATAENFLYVFSNTHPEEAYQVAVIRMFTAVPAHATFAILMGYFTGLAKFRQSKAIGLHLTGIFIAVVFHGFYDFLIFVTNIPLLWVGALLSLVVGVRYSFKALRLHQQRSPFSL